MIVAVPELVPLLVTTPVELPTVAIMVELLLHVPVPVSLSTVELPSHITSVPEIGNGAGLILIVMLRAQPDGNV